MSSLNKEIALLYTCRRVNSLIQVQQLLQEWYVISVSNLAIHVPTLYD